MPRRNVANKQIAARSDRSALIRYAQLSIAVAIVIIALKSGAYWITGSIGLLSDALESLVNLAAATVALIVLTVAARPADEEHPHGHDKAEYFSSGFEGAMIVVAAIGIAVAAGDRLVHPQAIVRVELGLAISVVAALINLAVARVLMRAALRHRSIALEADAQHLMADVWTSAGVFVGVAAVALTGWHWLDAVIGLAVAAHIVWIGAPLVRRSLLGLMDTALPLVERRAIENVLEGYAPRGIAYHALRTRGAGARRFISVHILVPGAWTVQQAHDIVEEIELELRTRLDRATILTHLEPIEDRVSWDDQDLDRS